MADYDFGKIPDWPDFEAMLDNTSGRIPVTKLAGWREFSQALEDDFFNRRGPQYVYRGQRRYDWSLTPNLGRLNPSGIVTVEIAEKQAEYFTKAVRGRLRGNSLVDEEQRDELWSIGQHHGLNTPLLDWTFSPFVALFFAFEHEDPKHEQENPYRVIYVIDKAFIADDTICPEVRVIEPKQDEHGRLVNQAGLFIYAPYGNTIENALVNSMQEEPLVEIDEKSEANEIAHYICKIYIANEEREGCLKNLRRMNVHHASLFPDLIGSSQYCNSLIAEEALQLAETKQPEKTKEMENEEESPSLTETGEEVQSATGTPDIVAILKAPDEAAQVEPGRIVFMAEELQRELAKNMVVDWEDREPAKARLRNVARVILRRLGYPAVIRDEIVTKLLNLLIEKEVESPENNSGT